ncbi:hypothetical protein QE177_12195 [Arsenophonus sp. aPb]|uniref:hypothetical protein n=1 Tax=Arsenophonus sp. aPb TaxID=3041619 RepID=UPI002468DD59|nr:hypothetical protein [Arsenophonus sp. aPb]WGL97938.1 hypothetical protein QE177_12195 [Arsenophonus sp. aPb]
MVSRAQRACSMIIKTQHVTGRALDWAVALATGRWSRSCLVRNDGIPLEYSCRWEDGGYLIDEYKMEFNWLDDRDLKATSKLFGEKQGIGLDHLEAACRLFVAARLGDEVDIADDLVRWLREKSMPFLRR